jgi:hypothetical protein
VDASIRFKQRDGSLRRWVEVALSDSRVEAVLTHFLIAAWLNSLCREARPE